METRTETDSEYERLEDRHVDAIRKGQGGHTRYDDPRGPDDPCLLPKPFPGTLKVMLPERRDRDPSRHQWMKVPCEIDIRETWRSLSGPFAGPDLEASDMKAIGSLLRAGDKIRFRCEHKHRWTKRLEGGKRFIQWTAVIFREYADDGWKQIHKVRLKPRYAEPSSGE